MTTFSGSQDTPWRKTFARYALDVLDALNGALAEEHGRTGLTKSAIAARLGVHRSEVTKLLNGRRRNMTMESIAALAWAMNRDIEFRLVGESEPDRGNAARGRSTAAPHGMFYDFSEAAAQAAPGHRRAAESWEW